MEKLRKKVIVRKKWRKGISALLGIFVILSLVMTSLYANKEAVEPTVLTNILVDTIMIEEPEDLSKTFLYSHIDSDNRDAFVLHTRAIARRLGVPYDHLMALFHFESGINYKAENKAYPYQDLSHAYGLIQFVPISRKALGITYEELRSMNEFEQLELVYKYFSKKKHKIKNFSDLCLTGYLPAYLGKPDETVIPNKYVRCNPTLGRTLGEFRHIANRKLAKLRRLESK